MPSVRERAVSNRTRESTCVEYNDASKKALDENHVDKAPLRRFSLSPRRANTIRSQIVVLRRSLGKGDLRWQLIRLSGRCAVGSFGFAVSTLLREIVFSR